MSRKNSIKQPQISSNFLPHVQHTTVDNEWSKHINENGIIYYYNELTGASAWLAPCFICGDTSERYCMDCKSSFCARDYESYHTIKLSDGAFHKWLTQEPSEAYLANHVDELKEGEVHCIECNTRVATRMCLECWDAYCNKCFSSVHHIGYLKFHKSISYARARCNWMKLRRPHDQADLYMNGQTGEITPERPEEFKSDLEKVLETNIATHEIALKENQELIKKIQAECARSKAERDQLLLAQNQTESAES